MEIDGVLDAIVTRLNGLSLTWGTGDSVASVSWGKYKTLAAQEGLQELPLGAVYPHPSRALQVRRLSSVGSKSAGGNSGYDLWTYTARIAPLAGNFGDLRGGLGDFSTWLGTICDSFASRAAAELGVDHVRDVRARPAEFLPSERMRLGYDGQVVEVEVEVVRERG